MGLTNQNVEMWQGEDKVLRFTIEDAEDLAGATALWRLAPPRQPAILSKSVNIGSGNVIDVVLNSADTLDKASTTYKHQLRVTDAAGLRNKVAEGNLVLHPIISDD
jgi:hypothetical protein